MTSVNNNNILFVTQPPLQVFGIEGRYATALYSAAYKQKSLDAVEKDLVKFQVNIKMISSFVFNLLKSNINSKFLQDSMKADRKLRDLVMDPSIKRRVKAEAFKDVGGKLGQNASTVNLLSLLAENGRLGKLNAVINAYKLIMSANRGEVVCEVVTAKPLEGALKTELEAALKGFLSKGQSIKLTTRTDPTIISGMIVSIGDKYVDMSTSSKIKKYSDIIQAAV